MFEKMAKEQRKRTKGEIFYLPGSEMALSKERKEQVPYNALSAFIQPCKERTEK